MTLGRKLRRTRPHYWSRPRKRKSGLRRLARASLMGITLAGVLLGAGGVIAKVAKPYLVGRGEARKISEINRQIGELESENEELTKEISYLSTPSGMEAEARKLGWVKEGETAVVVEGSQNEAAFAESQRAGRRSFWQRVGGTISGLFGGDRSKNGSR